MATKAFPIENVLTVYTGFCMKRGVGIAQDVFDHLYPGIMTLGSAAMQPKAADELKRQHPALAELPSIPEGGGLPACERVIAAARAIFGDTIAVEGPVAGASPTGLALELDEIERRRRD
jgi:hypothetical protein